MWSFRINKLPPGSEMGSERLSRSAERSGAPASYQTCLRARGLSSDSLDGLPEISHFSSLGKIESDECEKQRCVSNVLVAEPTHLHSISFMFSSWSIMSSQLHGKGRREFGFEYWYPLSQISVR